MKMIFVLAAAMVLSSCSSVGNYNTTAESESPLANSIEIAVSTGETISEEQENVQHFIGRSGPNLEAFLAPQYYGGVYWNEEDQSYHILSTDLDGIETSIFEWESRFNLTGEVSVDLCKYSRVELLEAIDQLEPVIEDLNLTTISIPEELNSIEVGSDQWDDTKMQAVVDAVKIDEDHIIFVIQEKNIIAYPD